MVGPLEQDPVHQEAIVKFLYYFSKTNPKGLNNSALFEVLWKILDQMRAPGFFYNI
jgi:hypothetical protein